MKKQLLLLHSFSISLAAIAQISHLSPLDSIKTYIDKNKHLPEVPLPKEMEKSGVNLGEMNMLLLKKIEELTLYVIEAKKENESLKTRIEKLESKKQL